MPEGFRSKGGGIVVNMDIEAAKRAAAELGSTLKKMSSGITLNEYFEDSATLIDKLRHTVKEYERDLRFGRETDEMASQLVKLSNAIHGAAVAAQKDIHEFVPDIDEMSKTIDAAVQKTGTLTHVFDQETFASAYRSLSLLKQAGIDLSTVFVKLSSEADYSNITRQLEDMSNAYAKAQAEASRLRNELNIAQSGDWQSEAEYFRNAAEREFSSFLSANQISQYLPEVQRAMDTIRSGWTTAGEAITDIKQELLPLFTQRVEGNGGMLDPSVLDAFVERLQPILDKVETLETSVKAISSGNTNVSELTDALSSLSKSQPNIAEGGMIGALRDIMTGNPSNLQALAHALAALARTGTVKFHASSLANLKGLFEAAERVKNPSAFVALSSLDLSKLSNFTVSQASLKNLATYLPVIANVDVDKLTKLANLPIDKLNGLKINIDLGKDRFEKEAGAVDNLNKKFREHAGVISAAITEEGRKYEASVQLTEQLKREKDALDQTSAAGGTNYGTNAANATAQQTKYTLDDLRDTLLKFGASEESVNHVVATLRESGMEVAKVAVKYDDLNGALERIQIAASDASGALKTVIDIAHQAATDTQPASWSFTQGDSADFARIAKEAEKQKQDAAKEWNKIWNEAQKAYEQYQIDEMVGAMELRRQKVDEAIRLSNLEAQEYAKDRREQIQHNQQVIESIISVEQAERHLQELARNQTSLKNLLAKGQSIGVDSDTLAKVQSAIRMIDMLGSKLADGTIRNDAYANAWKVLSRHIASATKTMEAAIRIQAKQNKSEQEANMKDLFGQRNEAYKLMLDLMLKAKSAEGDYKQQLEADIERQQEKLRVLNAQLEAYRELKGYGAAQASSSQVMSDARHAYMRGESKYETEQAQRQAEAWDRLAAKMAKLGAVSADFQNEYAAIQQMIAAGGANFEDAERRYEALAAAITNANLAQKQSNATQKEQQTVALTYDKLRNKITNFYHQNESEIKRNSSLMAQYEQLLNQLGAQAFGTAKDGATKAAAAVQQFQIACEQAGVGANSFIKKLLSGLGNKLFYGGLARMASYVRRLAREIYNATKEIDAAMTQLQIVTGASDSQMKQFLTQSTQLARELGQSISDVMKSIETFSRLGYNLPDASELARYATILSNVASVDVGTATTGLTSIIKAFGMQISDSEHVADVLVNVGQKYAISAEELMAAFERGGSALAATGTSFDKAAAIFAAANASMQNAEKIGTAIQTVSARIRGAKSELEELGADYEDVAEGVSKYRDELMALTNVTGTGGFDIMADVNTGKYKDIYDIFVGIAGVWNQLSDTSQARVAEILGGTRQLSVISSVIKNISDAQGALEVAQNSTGVALKANDTYLESIQARVGVLTADFQDLSQSILNSDLIKFGVSVLDILVRGIDMLAEVKVLLPSIVAIIAGINAVDRWKRLNAGMALFLSSAQASSRVTGDLISSFMGLNAAQQQRIALHLQEQTAYDKDIAKILQKVSVLSTLTAAERQELATAIQQNLVKSISTTYTAAQADADYKLILAMLGLQQTEEGVIVTTERLNMSLGGFMQVNPLSIIMTIASVLATVVIPLLDKYLKSTKELIDADKEAIETLQSLRDEYKTNADRIQELIDLKEKNDWSEESAKELQNLRDQNTELALQIAYRENLRKLAGSKAQTSATQTWNGIYKHTDQYYDAETGQITSGMTREQSLESYIGRLQYLLGQRQSAYQQDAEGNSAALDEQNKEIAQMAEDADAIIATYDELKDYLPVAVRQTVEPMIQQWRDLLDQTANDAPIIIKALDRAVSDLWRDGSMHGNALAALHNGLVSDMSAMKDAAENGEVSIGEYNAALSQLLALLNSNGANIALIARIKELFGSLGPSSNSLAYTAASSMGIDQSGKGYLTSQIFEWLNDQTLQDLEQFKQFLADVDLTGVTTFEELKAAFMEWQTVVEENTAKENLKSYFEALDDLQEHLSLLNTAFKEVNEDNSLGVTYKTLSSIAAKFADVDGIDTYINRLAAAGTNAQEVQGILRELAYQQILTSENSKALANASDDVVEALLREAGVSSQSKQAVYELRLAMIAANTTGMDFSAQCAEILKLAEAAGIAAVSIQSIFDAAEGGVMDENGVMDVDSMKAGIHMKDKAARLGITTQELAIKEATDRIKNMIRGAFTFDVPPSGIDSGGGTTDAYIADIDAYREAIKKLNQVQKEREALDRTISHTDEPRQNIINQRKLIDLYKQEQVALNDLNNLRRGTIKDNITELERLGFVIEYNAETNALWIANEERVNELTAATIEAQNELRKHAEELIDATKELNDANQEASDQWWDLKYSISASREEINALLQSIVDHASKAVDEIQSIYDALKKAADEYSTSGYLTVDTVQSLMALGTEYMQYLIDENGQLVINEQRIRKVIQAKMEQLAVENALTYVQSVAIALHQGDIAELNRLIFATEKYTDTTWGLVYAMIEALELTQEQKDAMYHNVDAIRALADSTGESLNRNAVNSQDGLSKILELTKSMLKSLSEQTIQNLNDQKDAYGKIIDAQKESLKLKQKENDYNKTTSKKLKEIAKLQAQLDILSLDDSREAQAKRKQLMEELANLNEELADTQNDHAVEAQEEALDQMQKEYNDEKDAEIKAEEKKYQSAQSLHDAALAYISDHWATLYDELIDWNQEYGSNLTSEIVSAWNACSDAVKRYGSFIAALNASNGGAQAMDVISEMKANSNAWNSAADQKRALERANEQAAQALFEQFGISLTKQNGVWRTSSGENIYNADFEKVADLIQQMMQNSAEWSVGNPNNTQLAAENEQIASILAEQFGLTAHKGTGNLSGVWLLDNGGRLYDIVDNLDEITCMVADMQDNSKEWLDINERQASYASSNAELGTSLSSFGLTAHRDDRTGVWYLSDGTKLYDYSGANVVGPTGDYAHDFEAIDAARAFIENAKISGMSHDEIDKELDQNFPHVDKRYLTYHTGGIAGTSTPRQDEIMAVLQKGEMILTKQQQQTISGLLTLMEILETRVHDTLKLAVPHYAVDIPSLMQDVGDVGGVTNVQFGDVVINGADRDTVAKHREVNREFVNEVIKVLNLKR